MSIPELQFISTEIVVEQVAHKKRWLSEITNSPTFNNDYPASAIIVEAIILTGIVDMLIAKEAVLIDALKFYMEPKNWCTPSTGFAVQYDPEPSPVGNDQGERAETALIKTRAIPTPTKTLAERRNDGEEL